MPGNSGTRASRNALSGGPSSRRGRTRTGRGAPSAINIASASFSSRVTPGLGGLVRTGLSDASVAPALGAGVLAGLMLSLAAGQAARAELNVDITQGFVEPLPIAVTSFVSERPEEAKVGREIDVLIDEIDVDEAVGRSQWDAPEIDGKVFLPDCAELPVGEIIRAEVLGAEGYDLVARPV